MPARSLPVESRSRPRPSGAGFRRTATQMALWRCAIAHRGADWCFWRTPAIACVAAQPPCSWHLPRPDRPPAGRAQRSRPNGCIDSWSKSFMTCMLVQAGLARATWPEGRRSVMRRCVRCSQRLSTRPRAFLCYFPLLRVFRYRAVEITSMRPWINLIAYGAPHIGRLFLMEKKVEL
jgi:hypothetical protein